MRSVTVWVVWWSLLFPVLMPVVCCHPCSWILRGLLVERLHSLGCQTSSVWWLRYIFWGLPPPMLWYLLEQLYPQHGAPSPCYRRSICTTLGGLVVSGRFVFLHGGLPGTQNSRLIWIVSCGHPRPLYLDVLFPIWVYLLVPHLPNAEPNRGRMELNLVSLIHTSF